MGKVFEWILSVNYRVGISGASGRMGTEVTALLRSGYVCAETCFELSTSASQSVDVWIDFSHPEATLALLSRSASPVVIGTTGFTPDQLGEIARHAQSRPLLFCPNTSVGINLLTRWVQEASGLAGLGFVASVAEDHHVHKKDAPSGTAKRLLEALKNAGFAETPVHVTRAGSIVGNHTVRFISDGEEIVLQHRVTDRRIFARGALWGARYLLQQKSPRLYTFDEVRIENH